MDVEDDSFTAVSDLQLIEKKFSRTSVTWKIFCLQKRAGSGDKIVSPIFRFSNKYWELTLSFYNSSCINSINLICVDTHPTSTCNIYLSSSTISDEQGIIKEIPDTSVVLCFCFGCSSQNIVYEIINIYQKSSLTVSLNICSEENIKPSSQERMNEEKKELLLSCPSKLFSDFEQLYENHQFSDVILKLGEEEFPAHKLVLSARSKVFAAMFEHDMKENLQGTVDLVQMEADTVQDMLRYIYCAKVRELSSTEALNLYVAADRYDLPELRDICRKVVVKDISVNNVFDIAAVADIHNDELLIRELKSFISKNGKDIINTEKWEAICTSSPVLVTKMFKWAFSG